MVFGDPIAQLQPLVCQFLRALAPKQAYAVDAEISETVRWRPHLLETPELRGWYFHIELPESDSWWERVATAKVQAPGLAIGIAAPLDALLDEEFLARCDELEASLLVLSVGTSGVLGPESYYPSISDFVYQTRLQLEPNCARALLDRALERALAEPDSNRKGVLLEVVVAMVLSQVRGFEVTDVGISNRSQQLDVLVHNRNSGGALSHSPLIIAEAKNWRDSVTPTEYAEFVRKLESRHGLAKLGYLVTTGRFTEGVALERRRESRNDTLVVLIDGRELTDIWRSGKTITEQIERLTIVASVGD